jgi:hypothetical protein
MPTKYLLSLIFLVASQGTHAAGARPPVEVADPHPSYKIFTQSPEELICWAAAAKSVLKMYPQRNSDSVCQIVSKIRNQNCCLPGDGIAESCNYGGRVQDVYRYYDVPFHEFGVDFDQLYRELKAGRLVNMIVNMSRFKNEERQGHVNTIYKAEKLDDGSYRFYVGDSGSYRWFRFLSRDVKRLRDGRWSYVSLNENFTIERFVTVLPQ